MIFLAGALFILITLTVVFVYHGLVFGGKSTGYELLRIKKAPNKSGEKFTNIYPTKESFGWEDYKKLLGKLTKGNPNKRPSRLLPFERWDKEKFKQLEDSTTTAIWFGHSAVYVKMNGKHILLDPMFGDCPAPLPVIGKRFNTILPVVVPDLPDLDAVVISHDHYDHLDYSSILDLKDKAKQFLVPLGVGAHLEAWGVEKEKIKELFWYEEIAIDDISFTCTPAQHFSGRSINDKMRTLWCSWVIRGKHTIFFSGDSGYFPEFKKIGDKFGPFDACFLECGQYSELCKDIHMFPEETVQAHLDLKGHTIIPIHWGAFALRMHDWDDPIIRLTKVCTEHNIQMATPEPGEPFQIGEEQIFSKWWKNYEQDE